MSQTFDVACVGNAKIDLFLSIHDANKCLNLNWETNELCFKAGDKISVDKCHILLGGNAANVAVGLSRLGLKSSLIAEIGDDELSQKIINNLTKDNVNIDSIKRSKDKESSISIILNFKGERTIFSEHVKRKHDFPMDNFSSKWIYLTSIGNEWENAYKKVANFVKQAKVHLAFNPGTLQIQSGYNSIARVLSITDILFVNKEEAMKISNFQFPISNKLEDIKNLLKKLQKLGPMIVVITDGKNGSYTLDEKGEILKQDCVQCKVVEKTGAGDSYTAGFLAAILRKLPIKEAMRWGALNAASVVGQIGAQAALLRKEEMEEKLKIL